MARELYTPAYAWVRVTRSQIPWRMVSMSNNPSLDQRTRRAQRGNAHTIEYLLDGCDPRLQDSGANIRSV